MKAAILFLVSFVAAASADGSNNVLGVCDAHRLPKVDPKGVKLPIFPDSVELFLEQTLIDERAVNGIHMDYNQKAKKMHVNIMMEEWTGVEIWIDANRDLYEGASINPGALENCKYQQLAGDFDATAFGYVKDNNGKVTLGTPQEVLHFTAKNQNKATYVGKGSIRGIPTDMWQNCQDIPGRNESASVVFHFAEYNLTTPFMDQTLLAAVVSASSLPWGKPTHTSFRYDYVNMKAFPDSDSDHLVPPPDMFCNGKSIAKNLPKLPEVFSFKTETLNFGDPTSDDAPEMSYTQQEYRQPYFMYTEIRLSYPDGNDYSDYTMVVDDFTLLLSYNVDLISGQCVTTRITKTGLDSVMGSDNKIRMRNPKEFFYLDRNYQYIGVRKHESRGIECDVWVSFDQNTMVVLYFATTAWKTQIAFETPETSLPVSVEFVTASDRKVYNIFEYATKPFSQYPDYTACFSPNDMIQVVMKLSGGTYHQMYLGDAAGFTKSFVQSLLQYGGFDLPTRVAKIDVQPGDGNNLLVTFVILGRPILGIVETTSYPSVTDIYKTLKGNLGYSFSVEASGGGIYGTLTVSNIWQRSYTPNHISDHSTGKQGGSSGYSSGSMAGIAFGLLAAGIIVGFAAIFLIHRIKSLRNRDGMNISMQPVENE